MTEAIEYPEGVTGSDHIAHDMKMSRFPKQSSLETFLAERELLDALEASESTASKLRAERDEECRISSALLKWAADAGGEPDVLVREWQYEIARAEKAEAEIERLREGLAFYRDGFQYHPKRSKTGVNLSEWRPKETLIEDCGERARALLTPELTQNG